MGTETEHTPQDITTTPATTPATGPVSQHPPPTHPAPPPAEHATPPEGKDSAPGSGVGPVTRRDTPTSAPPRDTATLPGPGSTARAGEGGGKKEGSPSPSPRPHPHSFHGPSARAKSSSEVPPLTLNQVAIVTASQNKLPTNKVKGIVTRMGRHTLSSAGKLGRWYKNDNYVDNANYSWRNMALFGDYQKQMYTSSGTVKTSCKK